MHKLRNTLTNVLLCLILLTGLGMLAYPTVSNYWNTLHQSVVITDYTKKMEQMDEKFSEELLKEARVYNQNLIKNDDRLLPDEVEKAQYEKLLDPLGIGVMGYLEIPKIKVKLPIYHGVSESVLQIAAGHIPGTSLPIGGESTHSILSGHRGLPAARLFTDLDQLREGDEFEIQILGQTLVYIVDQIRIVEPKETKELSIIEGEDYCTLVTCTPYGINTHRLLVRGHRGEKKEGEIIPVASDAVQIDPLLIGAVVAVLLLLILMGILIRYRRKKKSDFRSKILVSEICVR